MGRFCVVLPPMSGVWMPGVSDCRIAGGVGEGCSRKQEGIGRGCNSCSEGLHIPSEQKVSGGRRFG